MQLEQVETKKLIPYTKNARAHSEGQIGQIAASIQAFGFLNPIILDKRNGVIAGHGRLAAAQKLKLEHVPCVRAEHLTEAQKRAYILADNRLAELATWDVDLLKLELEELKLENFDLELTGFDSDFLKTLYEDGTENKYTTKVESPIYSPKGEKPSESELVDTTKTEALNKQIEELAAPSEVREFLRLAAQRHSVFNYEKIAEYYCHAPKEVQELMEKSALVILDFQKAIENGFVTLTNELAEAYPHEQTAE
jgi:hypothetical protein